MQRRKKSRLNHRYLNDRNDWRLGFLNLKKKGTRNNLIGNTEIQKLWIPELLFDNAATTTKVFKLLLPCGDVPEPKSGDTFHLYPLLKVALIKYLIM